MTFRNRPVLDRKHRPRWQDELRTQQLLVATFAIAIALALGIFGATAWNGYWDAHLRPVASVGGERMSRSDLTTREAVLRAELLADVAELQAQTGGPYDSVIQQQIEAISFQLSGLTGQATDSMVNAAALRSRAEEFGVVVSQDEIDAEAAQRRTLPERSRLQMILVDPLPPDAEPDAEATQEQLDAARAEADALVERLEAGTDFSTLAQEASDDFTAQVGGELGWVEAGSVTYEEQFEATREAEVGELVGPVETADGWAILKVADRRGATADETLDRLLAEGGIDDETYRALVRDELLLEAFRRHFADEIAAGEQPQQRVALIYVAPLTGTAVPQDRARHVLVQPIPDQQDQSVATEDQWAAALAEATTIQDMLSAPDADWFAVASESSDDPGSGARGGDLGWFDAANPGFVPEFVDALAALEPGELSEPVRSEFGYHVIQKTGERTSPQAFAAELVDQLRADPDTFADVASRVSEDYETAGENGELGWVARYQLDQRQEDAIFALDEVGEVSEPIDLAADGIYIFQLLETSESREVEEDRLAQIREGGFDRWLEQEVKASVQVWVDPQFASSSAT